MYCGKCGAELKDRYKHCGQCGAPVLKRKNDLQNQPEGKRGFITVISNGKAGRKYSLSDAEEVKVGRSHTCEVMIEAEEVSRLHCSIRYDGKNGIFTVTDYSSKGTFCMDGRRLPQSQPVNFRDGNAIFLAGPQYGILMEKEK